MKRVLLTVIILGCFILGGCGEKNEEKNNGEQISTGIIQEQPIIDTEPGEIDWEQFEEDIKILDAYIDDEKYQDGINFSLQIIEKYPDNMRFLSRIGKCYQKMGDTQNAIKYLLLASELAEDTNVNILYNLAKLYRDIGDIKEAKKYIERILKIEPENEKALSFVFEEEIDDKLGEDKKEVKKVLTKEEIEISLKEDPNSVELHHALGKILASEKDFYRAIDVYKKADELAEGKNLEIKRDLGVSYHNTGHIEGKLGYEKASATYNEILKLDPQNYHVQSLLEHNLRTYEIESVLPVVYKLLREEDINNYSEIDNQILELEKKYPDDSGVLAVRGKYYFNLGEYKKSEEYYLKASDATGNDDEYILYLLGVIMYNLGRNDEGKKYFDQALSLQPGFKEVEQFVKDNY